MFLDGMLGNDDDQPSFQFVQQEVVLSTKDLHAIPRTWILLDNQSTVDLFHNKDLLQNIRHHRERVLRDVDHAACLGIVFRPG